MISIMMMMISHPSHRSDASASGASGCPPPPYRRRCIGGHGSVQSRPARRPPPMDEPVAPRFEARLSGRSMRIMGAAVSYLGRVGKNILFEASPAGVSARSADELAPAPRSWAPRASVGRQTGSATPHCLPPPVAPAASRAAQVAMMTLNDAQSTWACVDFNAGALHRNCRGAQPETRRNRHASRPRHHRPPARPTRTTLLRARPRTRADFFDSYECVDVQHEPTSPLPRAESPARVRPRALRVTARVGLLSDSLQQVEQPFALSSRLALLSSAGVCPDVPIAQGRRLATNALHVRGRCGLPRGAARRQPL